MASVQAIKDAVKKLESSGPIDKNAIIKEIIKKDLINTFKSNNVYESMKDKVDGLVEETVASASPRIVELAAKIDKINSVISTVPALITKFTTMQAQVMATAAVGGMAAPAAIASATGMATGLASQAMSAKQTLLDTLQTAASLGVDLPVEPLITAADTIEPFTKFSI